MKTKHFLSFVLLGLLLNPLCLLAQELLLRHEIYVSRGVISTPKLSLLVNDLFTFVGNAYNSGGDDVIDTKITTTNVIKVGYNYALNKKNQIGIIASFEQLSDRENYRSGSSRQHLYTAYTLLANVQRNWIDKPDRAVYSGFAMGVGFKGYKLSDEPSEDNDYATFAYQLTPLGIRLGKKLSVFAEIGFGWQGMVSWGILGRF